MSQDFMQFCYVTNDFDQAIDRIRSAHSMGPFKEMRELRVPTGPGRAAVGHFGLAFKAGIQFEIIEPVAGDIGIYQDVLGCSGFAMHFHHVGRHIASLDEYRETLRQARARWTVPIEVDELGGHYAYADSRTELGHYLEFFCFPAGSLADDAPHY